MLALAAVLLLSAPPTHSLTLRDNWELLGTRKVSFAAEKDVISAKHQGRFRAIKLEVEGGNLDMYNIRLVFGDGTTFSPDTRVEFHEGSWSRTIDLPGDARVIRRIEFWYRSELKRGRATVRVYGIANGSISPPADPTAGWSK